MTIPATPSEISYAGNGVSLAFPIPFTFDTSADIKVVSTDSAGVVTELTTGFSITGGGGSTGTCTFLVAPAALTTITILDNPAQTQTADYIANDSFPAEAHEAALDRTVRLVKRLNQRVGRSLRVADGDLSSGDSLLLPIASTRQGKFLAFDANGNPSVSSGVGGADTALRTDLANIAVGNSLIAVQRTAAENTAAATVSSPSYENGDPRRYPNVATWAAVYAAVTTLAAYTGWYRGDHAQHVAGTNTIIGWKSYDDSQMTGTLGYRATFVGVLAAEKNKLSTLAGGSNTGVGFATQQNGIDTSGNTSIGGGTLQNATGVVSAHNFAGGYECLTALITGTQNNGTAYRCMYQLLRGSNNTGNGDVVLQGLIAGSANTCAGAQSGFTKPGGNYLVAYGYQSCFHETAATITAISKAALAVVTVTGATAPYVVNDYVTFSDVSGMTEINDLAGIVTLVAGGPGAWAVTVAINSTGFSTYTTGGYCAPYGNLGVGYKVQFENTFASGNTTTGTESASTAVLGPGNTINGFQGGRAINGASFNTLNGWRVALLLSSGTGNTVTGSGAAPILTTGSNNLIEGNNCGSGMTTGIRCTLLGSGTAGTGNWNNVTALGFNAQPIADNTITFGDTNIIQIRAQVTVITAISDANYKKNIQPLAVGSAFVRGLKMVSYQWDNDKPLLAADGSIGIEEDGIDWPSSLQVGIVAQDLDALQTEHGCEWLGLVDKTNPNRWEATPGKLLYPLIASHQDLFDRHDALSTNLAQLSAHVIDEHQALRNEHAALIERVAAIEHRLAA